LIVPFHCLSSSLFRQFWHCTFIISLQAAFLAESCIINDLARSVVIKDIQGGNVQTAKWWLERRVREEFSNKAGINPPSENIAPDNTLRIEIDDSTE